MYRLVVFSAFVLLSCNASAQAGTPAIDEADNLFAYQGKVQSLDEDMTSVRWRVTNRSKTSVHLSLFQVAYQCGDGFVDVLEHEYRDLIAPGKTVELPGDYYVCIRHQGIKQHSFTEVSFSQHEMPVANSLQCSNGARISFVVEPVKQHGYRLVTRKGDVITLAGNELNEARLGKALCKDSAVQEPGSVAKLVQWLRGQLEHDKGRTGKSVGTGKRG